MKVFFFNSNCIVIQGQDMYIVLIMVLLILSQIECNAVRSGGVNK